MENETTHRVLTQSLRKILFGFDYVSGMLNESIIGGESSAEVGYVCTSYFVDL